MTQENFDKLVKSLQEIKNSPNNSGKQLSSAQIGFLQATFPEIKMENVKPSKCKAVDTIKKYDIIYRDFSIEVFHYAVVYKVIGDLCYCFMMTSKEHCFSNIPIKTSRCFSGYFVNIISVCTLEEAKSSFCFTWDGDKKEINDLANQFKQLCLKL